MAQIKSKHSKQIKRILDDYIPSYIRDRRWFYTPIIRFWNRKMDPDFKVKAHLLTEEDFRHTYEALVPMRDTDMTADSTAFVLGNLIGSDLLETGCGNGDISLAAAAQGFQVTATDLAEGNLALVRQKAEVRHIQLTTNVASVELLPYADNSFDTVLCLHTLEHVRKPTEAIREIKRVAAKRVIVVVPKQRYFRYTCDYHLNFYPSAEALWVTMDMQDATCTEIDNCLCFVGNKTQP